MDITLRILPTRESDDLFVVSASSLVGAYTPSVQSMTLEDVHRLLNKLQLEPEYLKACQANAEAGRSGTVWTVSDVFEEAVASVHADRAASPR
jgi:hypothetical protein